MHYTWRKPTRGGITGAEFCDAFNCQARATVAAYEAGPGHMEVLTARPDRDGKPDPRAEIEERAGLVVCGCGANEFKDEEIEAELEGWEPAFGSHRPTH